MCKHYLFTKILHEQLFSRKVCGEKTTLWQINIVQTWPLVGDVTVRGCVEQKREGKIKEEEEEGENIRVDGKGVGESTADEEIEGRGHWKKGGD